jgi:hypothetical protein
MSKTTWDAARVALLVAEIKARFAQTPPPAGTAMSAFIEAIRDLPDEWKGLALQCTTAGYEFGVDMKLIENQKFQRESLLCGVGIALLLVGVALAFKFDHFTPQQDMACCTLTALGAASFLIFLPGFLSLRGMLKPNIFFESLKFRAGGGAAIFLLVFIVLHHSLKQ